MSIPKILLVDDVDFFLELEKDFLRQTPAEILVANNGRTALEMAAKHRPDLIFMDVNMPVMDGLDCCRRLKQDAGLSEIPVVMVFAPDAEVSEATCRSAGCDGVLHKPLDRRAFLDLGHHFLFDIERREPRIPCQMTVDFRLGGRDLQGMGLNLSRRGMYIGFRQQVQLDDWLRVSFLLPAVSSERIELRARVTWLNQGFPRPDLELPQGFGLEFRDVPAHAAVLIREFLTRFENH